jgi:hypothetical protein
MFLLLDYSTNDMSETIREMHIFSGSCPGQTRNNTVIRFLATLAANGTFNKIFQYFSLRRPLAGTLDFLKK